ncbi:MAG: serine/threonine-protein phosphatase [Deltaproteobacteria bacterium]|jgi:serine phosphatase RsbU (regulator of sigma subunit)|nr:serine/threonine-protein phosphatase [Deltaproteobacteria bacterium]MCW8893720.1 serine/threonine-protein phosphatase [Deltaproteobacteria bacterium]
MSAYDKSSQYHTDLTLAGEVQQLLFPKSSPICSWCCIGVKNRMAKELGGDYFDFISMPDRCQSLLLGDATGHGLHASLVMSLIYGFIYRAVKGTCSPCDIAKGINSLLNSFGRRTNRFDHLFSSTLFFAIVDPESLKMDYVNCGQVAPLIKRGDAIRQLESSGPPLGFFDSPEMGLKSFQFQPGDRLLVYTDGIPDRKNGVDQPFGIDRIAGFLRNDTSDHLELLENLFQQNDRFSAGQEADDDMTAIVFDFHPPFGAAAV